jgi:hypothetical protein
LPRSIKEDEFAQQASKSVLFELAKVTDTKQQRSLWSEVKKDIKAGNPVSVRKVREKRTAQTSKETPTPSKDAVVMASKQFSRQLAELTAEELASSPERQETLRAIKERLDELFAGLPEASPAPEERSEEDAAA